MPRSLPGSPRLRWGPSKKLLTALQWHSGDVDLYEVNEAFAVVTMAAMEEHNIPHERINVHGGACALGPSGWCFRGTHPGYPAGRHATALCEAWGGIPVHRRR